MKRAYGISAAIFLIAASGAAALGQVSRKPLAQDEDVATTAAVLDHVWLDAAHNGDAGTMDWLFANDFIEIHPGGMLANKQEQVDQIRNPQGALLDIAPSDIHVFYTSPDVAVLTDTTTIHGKSGDVNYDGTYRVMRVFVKQRGRWRAAGAGMARLSTQ